MIHYDVYFELYGKKMKTTIIAENENDAKKKVQQKIIFHKIQKNKNLFEELINIFK